MKTLLSNLLYFFMFAIVGTLAGGFIYMISLDLTLLVAGLSLKFFELDFFVKGLLISFPIVMIFDFLFLSLYSLRHKFNPFVKTSVFWVLGILTWLFLIPASFSLNQKFESKFEKPSSPNLTPGVFRKAAGGVFYFSRVRFDEKVDGVFIDLTGISGEKGKIIKFYNADVSKEFSGSYADSIIEKAVELPFVIKFPLKIYSSLLETAKIAWQGGIKNWILFCSFGILLLSTSFLENLSAWKLVNGISQIFCTFIVCIFNFAFSAGFILKNVAENFNEKFIFNSQNIFAKLLSGTEFPLLYIINFFFILIFIVSGIILFAVNRKKGE